MNMRRGAVSLLAVCFAVVGCAGEEATPSVTSVPGAPVRIEEAPSLSVGVVQGDTLQEFYRVTTPFLLPDGRLVVPLRSSSELRVFDPDGEFLQTLGRAGEGPGEFGSLASAWPRGDTIEAFDNRLVRITRFLPDGSVEVVQLLGAGRAESAPAGALADGWVTARLAGGEYPGRDLIAVDWFSRDGTHAGEIGRAEGMLRMQAPGAVGPHPLSPRAVLRVGRGEVYLADTEAPRIQVLGPPGAALREVTWEVEGSLDPQAAIALVRDSVTARADGTTSGNMREAMARNAEVPDEISALWDFMVDDLGFIWVCPYDPAKHAFTFSDMGGGGYITGGSARGGRWRLFSPAGTEVGSIEVPDGMRLAQITRDAVVVVRMDPLGVESVRVHALERY